jgi:hypothetical protein
MTPFFIVDASDPQSARSIFAFTDPALNDPARLLLEHYATQEKVNALISLGDLYALAERPDPSPGSQHSASSATREPGVCIAYGRDWGFNPIITTAATSSLDTAFRFVSCLSKKPNCYVWTGTEWQWCPTPATSIDLRPLTVS